MSSAKIISTLGLSAVWAAAMPEKEAMAKKSVKATTIVVLAFIRSARCVMDVWLPSLTFRLPKNAHVELLFSWCPIALMILQSIVPQHLKALMMPWQKRSRSFS
jgi:hypothetical protein